MRLLLDQQALKNLIAMTPYAYKASPERRLVRAAAIRSNGIISNLYLSEAHKKPSNDGFFYYSI